MPRLSPPASALTFLSLLTTTLATGASGPVQVNSPAAPPGDNVTAVNANFFGISLELSFINYYFGNDTSTMSQTMINYLNALHERASGSAVRLRLGGNSMDSSTYIPNQQQIIQFTDPNANVNDQPVTYGSVLFDIMKAASDKVGVQWLMGLSLRDPNSTNIPLVAGDAQKFLGDDLDAFLLGNEPDLYTSHGQRPNLQNYTINDYIGDYWVATENLEKTSDGDVLSLDKLAGPTICCDWDLAAVLTSDWLKSFGERLRYITLQHYPQNNCNNGYYPYHLDYYMSHTNTVNLAKWQEPGLQFLASTPAAQRKPLLMDEFNSASCGGVPESNTFGAALWAADYALQMASMGYSGAYLHTRERGVSYNIFDPPAGPAGGAGAWTTNANWYAMLAVTEALQSTGGSRVVDLNIANSQHDYAAVQAGYAVYDASASKINHLALFNYANNSASGTDFTLASSFFSDSSNNILVRYLTAPSATETTNIIWGNQTYAGSGDGTLVSAQTQWQDKTFACSSGCTVQVPGPGMAVVFIAGNPTVTAANNVTSNTGNGTKSGGGGGSSGGSSGNENGATHTGGAPLWMLVMGALTFFVVSL